MDRAQIAFESLLIRGTASRNRQVKRCALERECECRRRTLKLRFRIPDRVEQFRSLSVKQIPERRLRVGEYIAVRVQDPVHHDRNGTGNRRFTA